MKHQIRASSPAKKATTVASAGPKQWVLYLLECRSGAKTSYYSGITNDLQARFNAHVSGKGAKYTRSNMPIRIVASCAFADRATASSAEWHLKQQPRARKLAYLQAMKPVLSAATTANRKIEKNVKLTKNDKSLIDGLFNAAKTYGVMEMDKGSPAAINAEANEKTAKFGLVAHVQGLRATIASLKAKLENAITPKSEAVARPRQRG